MILYRFRDSTTNNRLNTKSNARSPTGSAHTEPKKLPQKTGWGSTRRNHSECFYTIAWYSCPQQPIGSPKALLRAKMTPPCVPSNPSWKVIQVPHWCSLWVWGTAKPSLQIVPHDHLAGTSLLFRILRAPHTALQPIEVSMSHRQRYGHLKTDSDG